MANYLVTGCAGFIGSHLCHRLLKDGHNVVGVDNFRGFYSLRMKHYRLKPLEDDIKNFQFLFLNVSSEGNFCPIVRDLNNVYHNVPHFDAIFHLAAWPGVRPSIERPYLYIQNNIQGSISILRTANELGIKKVILASSSSVYGDTIFLYPCAESDDTDKPLSPYAASKKAMELMAYTYHKLYGYDVTIPRYFTVYGPAGRPDMAYFKFIRALMTGKQIEIYGDGKQKRDFTYIDDVVDATVRMVDLTGYHIINVGSNHPVSLNTMIELIKRELGLDDIGIRYSDSQQGDVKNTWACNDLAKKLLDWEPQYSLPKGLKETVKWFRDEYDKVGMEDV